MILLHDNARPHVAKVIKDYRYFNRKSYHTSRMCVPLQIITYFDQCSTNTSKHMNKLKNGSMNGLLQKTNIFYHGIDLLPKKWEKVTASEYFE